MTLVVDLLSEALKKARKSEEHYDLKTFQSMVRDEANKTI
jgi:hypothetical protein